MKNTQFDHPFLSGVNSESHDVLRSDVSRLEVALGGVRQDLKGLRGCQDHCDRLDHMEEMVRVQELNTKPQLGFPLIPLRSLVLIPTSECLMAYGHLKRST